MKKNLLGFVLLLAVMSSNAQVQFLKSVNYRGAFAPSPTEMWTKGWANWDPQNAVYGTATRTISGVIKKDTHWSKDTVYLIQGLVYVMNNATLTIEAGTVIRGDFNVANTSLVITKGSKVYAIGTATSPIVFTSNKPAGSRAPGDWGGIILLGKAPINVAGGSNNIEGIVATDTTSYGGTDPNDNSGTLKYVRCEFGGYVFQPNKEINGFTFGGVGRGTTIDYVQSSFANDDAFEWFGGNVNCSHLISYRGVDDEFDTDNGFSGTVQFCLGVRDPQIGDATWNVSGGSTSEGFESDNDAAGSTNTPKTAAIFSNITFIGPLRGDASATNQAAIYPAFRRNARIRRNSELKVINCVMMDYPRGLFVDNNGTAPTSANALAGTMIFANNILAGNVPGQVIEPGNTSVFPTIYSWFASNHNDSVVSTSSILTRPYDWTNPDFRPATGSIALSGADFTNSLIAPYVISEATNKNVIKKVDYRGAFAPAPTAMWTTGWANWDPNNTVYPATTVTVSGTITTNTTWTKNNTYLIQGLVYVMNGATLTIEAGTVIRGDFNVANTSLVITKGSKLIAVGTVNAPIVFTSNKPAGSRAPGDWGGLILLGKAPINVASGSNNIEGIVATDTTAYGGSDPEDNSGTIKYVRVEFGGYVFQPNKEINGVTFGGVGRGTTVDYVQSSFANDDAFEWFGGTVNCSHLISYRGVDDEFDTDNGFSGTCQFLLGVRDPQIGDATWNVSGGSTSEGFESDNDAAGSANTPYTSAIFTNVTFIGPLRGNASAANQSAIYPAFRRNARIRRNSRLRVLNCVMMDYPRGLFVDNNGTVPTSAAALSGSMRFSNNLLAGNVAGQVIEPGNTSVFPTIYSWFADNHNDSLVSTTGILVNPYNFTSPDYRPSTTSPALVNYNFEDTIFNGVLSAATYDLTVPSGDASVVSSNLTYNNVTLNGGSLTINSGVTLTITGGLSLNSGTIINNGGSIVYGSALIVNAGNSINLNGVFANDVINNGTINLTDNSTFSGSITNNGIITGAGSYLAAKKLTLSGASANLAGNGSIGVLEINSNGTITNTGTDSLKVINKLILTNGTLASNGKLTFKSTSLDSTAVVDVVTGGNISGNVVSERVIPNKFRAFRDLAAGVNTNGTIFSNWQEGGNTTSGYGIFITGAKGTAGSADATSGIDLTSSGSPSAETYRNGNWYIYSNQPASYGGPYYTKSGIYSTLDYHNGFRMLVRGDRSFNLGQSGLSAYFMVNKTTIRTTGSLVTGDVNYSSYLNNTADGYTMIGNPYLAPINFDAIMNDPSNSITNLTRVYYYLTRNDSTNGISGPQGALSSYATYDVDFGGSSDAVTPYIMPGQAFFVQHDATTNAGTLTIKESHKAANKSRKQYGIFGTTTTHNLYVSLLKNTEFGFAKADAVKVLVNESLVANRSVTKFANDADNLSILDGKNASAIAGFKKLSENDVINLSLDKLTVGTEYKLTLNAAAFNVEGLTPFVLDRKNNTTNILSPKVETISFTASTADANRFAIVFKVKAVSDIVATSASISAYPNPVVGGTLHLATSNLVAGKYNVVIYNTLGKKVFTTEIESTINMKDLKVGSLVSGHYNLVVTSGTKVVYNTALQVK